MSGWTSVNSPITDTLTGISGRGSSTYDLVAVGAGVGLRGGTATFQQIPAITWDLSAYMQDTVADGWAVGSGGTIVHFDGTWNELDNTNTNVTDDLYGVWAAGPTDVVAVGGDGSGALWTFNGTTWQSTALATTRSGLRAVSGFGSNVFAVGLGGTILQRKSGTWSAVASGTTDDLNAVHVVSSTQAWAAGANGTVVRWNGTTWSAENVGLPIDLYAIQSNGTEVWAVGDLGSIFKRAP